MTVFDMETFMFNFIRSNCPSFKNHDLKTTFIELSTDTTTDSPANALKAIHIFLYLAMVLKPDKASDIVEFINNDTDFSLADGSPTDEVIQKLFTKVKELVQ
ncbi:hypothetical protein [Lacticaseibacillus mingshuiensis]|uniref:Phage protein n=1 Tax=Lacticaseibacillus mingshuiensis TaxID=2799574 RepID=A0ABW4CF90_9LACO|nr:hypothetical protein [Lacticaseibacillus mingshuiensis]